MKQKHSFKKFQSYWRALSPQTKESFAMSVGSTVDYMKQISGGHSRPSPKLSTEIEKFSFGAAPRAEFHPELFA